MSQHDFNIANQTAVNARTDINNALVALASTNSGSTPPSTTVANMLWYETDTNKLWIRNEGNTAWLILGYIDQSNGLEPFINGKQVTAFLDQDNMSSNSSTAVASQQSIKAYVDSSVTTAKVAAAMAGVAYGAVGSYVFAGRYLAGSHTFVQGSTYAGSALKPAGAGVAADTMSDGANSSGYPAGGGSALSGTWRAMGRQYRASSGTAVTLFLRIS